MNAQYYFKTGMSFIEKKKYKEALSCFEEAVKLQPDFADANFGVGVCKIKIGDIASGESSILKAARLGNKEAKSYFDFYNDNINNKATQANIVSDDSNNSTANIELPSHNRNFKRVVPPPLSPHGFPLPQDFSLATRWPRFFARIFDVWWEVLLVSFTLGTVLGRYSAGFVEWINSPGASQLLGIFCIPIGLILDAAVYRVFGNTPGKALLGLKVGAIDGKSLSFGQYMSRNLSMWASGMALGFPLIILFTMAYQSGRIGKGKQASYDETAGYRVHKIPIHIAQKLIFGFAFAGIFIVMAIANKIGQSKNVEYIQSNTKNSYSWKNPITRIDAKINSLWMSSVHTDGAGQPVYVFSDQDNRSVTIFGVEHAPEYDLIDYAQAFQKSTAENMHFLDVGGFFEKDGHQVWQGSGTIVGSSSNHFKVQVIKIGPNFWRVVTVQSMPLNYSDRLIAQLQADLWSTVK